MCDKPWRNDLGDQLINDEINEEDRDSIEEIREKVDKDYIIKKEENCET